MLKPFEFIVGDTADKDALDSSEKIGAKNKKATKKIVENKETINMGLFILFSPNIFYKIKFPKKNGQYNKIYCPKMKNILIIKSYPELKRKEEAGTMRLQKQEAFQQLQG